MDHDYQDVKAANVLTTTTTTTTTTTSATAAVADADHARGVYQRLSFDEDVAKVSSMTNDNTDIHNNNNKNNNDDDDDHDDDHDMDTETNALIDTEEALSELAEVVEEQQEEFQSNANYHSFVFMTTGQRERWKLRLYHLFHTTLIPDSNGILIGSIPVVDGMFAVKLLKFLTITYLLITMVHLIVPFVSTDRDPTLTIWQIWMFDGNLIATDAVLFFVIGRLWKQRGIDHLAWISWIVLCNLYFEGQDLFPFLQHSATLYEMHCLWPWQLWLFAAILVPILIALVICHLRRAYKKKLLLMKLIELCICCMLFVAPLVTSPYFHLHHWFAGWLIGMHCNFDVWWSRAVMAWCWGAYINGIAVYGRDPVLTCQYSYFLSLDQQCPYIKCYEEGRASSSNETVPVVKEMVPPDWRNCSADTYHG